MSNFKKTKDQSFLTFNLGKIIDKSFYDYKPKYKELMLLIIKKMIKNKNKNVAYDIKEFLKYTLNLRDDLIEELINDENFPIFSILRDVIKYEHFEIFNEFINLHDKGLLHKKDLTSYNSFDEIEKEVSTYRLNKLEKLTEDQYEKFYEDKNWLILIPFTHLASVNYGYNTKWCVSMVDKPSYFFDHINETFLFFIIDKTNDKKAAAAFNKNFLRFYDNIDEQRDSITFNFPEIILTKIREIHKINKTSFEYIPNEVKEKYFYLEQSKNKVNQLINEAPIDLNT